MTENREPVPRIASRNACGFALAPAIAALALLSGLAATEVRAQAPPALRTIAVQVAGHSLRVEVADTDASRSTGLMHRAKMGTNDGMLFVFPEPGYHSM